MTPTLSTSNGSESPVVTYARLLRQLHEFIRNEQRETPEAEAVADKMDRPWLLLSEQERERVGGLAEDLYALPEGGPKAIEMAPAETDDWRETARKLYETLPLIVDADEALAFLRQPHPSSLPPGVIPFLQGQCWEWLGNLETAIVFYREAARLDSGNAAAFIRALLNLRHFDEAVQESERLIDAPESGPEELFLAVAPFLAVAKEKPHEAKDYYGRVATTLTKAEQMLSRRWSGAGGKPDELHRYVTAALALSLRELGELSKALQVLDRAIAKNPAEADLLALRGTLRYQSSDVQGGLSDFAEAIRRGTTEFWPYFYLARHALQQRAWSLALMNASRAAGLPAKPVEEPANRAETYEIIAIAQAALGQPAQLVLDNFNAAIAIDPTNERIQRNSKLARTLLDEPAGGVHLRWDLGRAPDTPTPLVPRPSEVGMVLRAGSAADTRAGKLLAAV
jgi:tetratricopeptide (TPR) repeat protein